jgi:hypothetical protein
MSRKAEKNKKLSRREFLKNAGLATGGAALGGLGLINACSGTKTETFTSAATLTRTVTTTVANAVTSTVTSSPSTGTTTVTTPATITPPQGVIKVMNPLGYPPLVQQKPMAARPTSLDGKKIYLVDVTFDDGDMFLKEMQAWFARKMPQVNLDYRVKTGVYSNGDLKLWQEIKDAGGVVIMAIGH